MVLEHRGHEVTGHEQDTDSRADEPLSVQLADARASARRARTALSELEERLDAIERKSGNEDSVSVVEVEPSWRQKLWSCPPETRLNAEQAAEATGMSVSTIYKATSAEEIPHRKMSGGLVFVAGELRSWLRERESVEVEGRMELDGETEYLRRAK